MEVTLPEKEVALAALRANVEGGGWATWEEAVAELHALSERGFTREHLYFMLCDVEENPPLGARPAALAMITELRRCLTGYCGLDQFIRLHGDPEGRQALVAHVLERRWRFTWPLEPPAVEVTPEAMRDAVAGLRAKVASGGWATWEDGVAYLYGLSEKGFTREHLFFMLRDVQDEPPPGAGEPAMETVGELRDGLSGRGPGGSFIRLYGDPRDSEALAEHAARQTWGFGKPVSE